MRPRDLGNSGVRANFGWHGRFFNGESRDNENLGGCTGDKELAKTGIVRDESNWVVVSESRGDTSKLGLVVGAGVLPTAGVRSDLQETSDDSKPISSVSFKSGGYE